MTCYVIGCTMLCFCRPGHNLCDELCNTKDSSLQFFFEMYKIHHSSKVILTLQVILYAALFVATVLYKACMLNHIIVLCFSCWLPKERGIMWAFLAPVISIILVSIYCIQFSLYKHTVLAV